MMLWLVIGYLFLFIFRPYEYWPSLGTFHIERIYMILLIVVALFNRGSKLPSHPINRRIMAFFAAIVLSGIFAVYFDPALNRVIEYFKIFVFYLIVVATIKTARDLKYFIVAYVAIMFAYVGKSAWEFYVHGRYDWAMGIARMMGIDQTFADPNNFAASIVYSLPFVYALLKAKFEERWISWMCFAYGALSILAIVKSASRSGMICAIAFVVLAALGSSRKLMGTIAAVAILAITWNVMPEQLQIRFESIFVRGIEGYATADASAEGRVEGFKEGLRLFLSRPVSGVGPGNFRYTAEGVASGFQPHNLYGQLMSELGLIGILTFFMLLWSIYGTCRRNSAEVDTILASPDGTALEQQDKKDVLFIKLLAVACMQTLFLLLLKGNADHNLYRYTWMWLGAIAVVSSVALAMRADKGLKHA